MTVQSNVNNFFSYAKKIMFHSLKSLKLSPEVVQENIEIMMELLPLRLHWEPEATFYKLGGIGLLCQLIGVVQEHVYHPGRYVGYRASLGVTFYKLYGEGGL